MSKAINHWDLYLANKLSEEILEVKDRERQHQVLSHILRVVYNHQQLILREQGLPLTRDNLN
jgi:HD superfamily phosphodiesterase